MDKALNFYANYWIGLIIILSLIDDRLGKNKKEGSVIPESYYAVLGIISQVLTMIGYGNAFWTITVQAACALIYSYFLCEEFYYETKHDRNTIFQIFIKNFLLIIYVLFCIYCVYKRIILDKDCIIKTIKNVICVDYTKLLLSIANNEWFKGICIGIISAIPFRRFE